MPFSSGKKRKQGSPARDLIRSAFVDTEQRGNERQKELRQFALRAIEMEAPDVLESLYLVWEKNYRKLIGAYMRLGAAELSTGLRDHLLIHDLMLKSAANSQAVDLSPQENDQELYRRELGPQLAEARESLISWADGWRLREEWMVKAALDTMYGWFNEAIPANKWHAHLSAAGFMESFRFTYKPWDLYDRHSYQKEALRQCQGALVQYLDGLEATTLKKTVNFDHIRWMVLSWVRKLKLDQIAQKEHRDPSTIFRGIKLAVQAIGPPFQIEKKHPN